MHVYFVYLCQTTGLLKDLGLRRQFSVEDNSAAQTRNTGRTADPHSTYNPENVTNGQTSTLGNLHFPTTMHCELQVLLGLGPLEEPNPPTVSRPVKLIDVRRQAAPRLQSCPVWPPISPHPAHSSPPSPPFPRPPVARPMGQVWPLCVFQTNHLCAWTAVGIHCLLIFFQLLPVCNHCWLNLARRCDRFNMHNFYFCASGVASTLLERLQLQCTSTRQIEWGGGKLGGPVGNIERFHVVSIIHYQCVGPRYDIRPLFNF